MTMRMTRQEWLADLTFFQKAMKRHRRALEDHFFGPGKSWTLKWARETPEIVQENYRRLLGELMERFQAIRWVYFNMIEVVE